MIETTTREIDTPDGVVSLTISFPDGCACYDSTLRFPKFISIEVLAPRKSYDFFELNFDMAHSKASLSLTRAQLSLFIEQLVTAMAVHDAEVEHE